MTDPASGPRRGFSRRRFLAGAASVTGAAALGGVTGYAAAPPIAALTRAPNTDVIPFRGAHQAGIATPAQDRMAFAAFDLTTGDRAALVAVLKRWTEAAERMTRGEAVGEISDSPLAPPVDTGEATGLSPARLTLTIGFGPSLFDDRFGLRDLRPAALAEIPAFPGDLLESGRNGGDLCIQACADDPQVAFHAVRNLARLGRGAAVVRWFQFGFGRTSLTSVTQSTPRNLMGFKDGTNNIVAEDQPAMDQHVWVPPGSDGAWMTGGSYLVARRIRMRIESWDRASLDEQQQIIGRHKDSGAPAGGVAEHDTVDLATLDAEGSPLIAEDAHIRLAAPATNGGERLLRRGYSFTDGIDPRTGELDAGLFFICYQRDPRTQFVPIQQRLARSDSLNEYLRHTGSAVFACPPGIGPGEHWGAPLLPS